MIDKFILKNYKLIRKSTILSKYFKTVFIIAQKNRTTIISKDQKYKVGSSGRQVPVEADGTKRVQES